MTDITPPGETMTAIEAAVRLNVGLDFIYSLVWSHKLRGFKRGGRWHLMKEDVEKRLAARTRIESES